MRTVLTTLHSKFIHASLALPCLQAFCGSICGEMTIREFTVHEPKEKILAALLAEDPDVVAFSVYLWNRRESLELADALAVARPGLRVVVGGPEVSFDGPELFDRHPGVAALVRGEGEIPLRGLLSAWSREDNPRAVTRLTVREGNDLTQGSDGPSLENLDLLPSPFRAGLVDPGRGGLVYYETSRGCPYTCAFCLSALDHKVRSFSQARIRDDLDWLMDHHVSQVKLVDRTFNYDAARAREIWSYILRRNCSTRFHFEIGGHLLDSESLALLEKVPPGMFQFEIGVQSTLPQTLSAVARRASLERLEENVRRLRARGNIHLHLDLIAGLPGEDYRSFLASIDRIASLAPHHLQVEPVKLLPGSPLRQDADLLGIRFDPHPPYAVLGTPDLSFGEIERLRGLSRLLDLTFNSGRFGGFLEGLKRRAGSLATGLELLEAFWREAGLFRFPLSQRALFERIGEFVGVRFTGKEGEVLRELLARDFASSERVVPDNHPGFFDTDLTEEESIRVEKRVGEEIQSVKGTGTKVQHFAAVFERLPGLTRRTVLLFLYKTRAGEGMEVGEVIL